MGKAGPMVSSHSLLDHRAQTTMRNELLSFQCIGTEGDAGAFDFVSTLELPSLLGLLQGQDREHFPRANALDY